MGLLNDTELQLAREMAARTTSAEPLRPPQPVKLDPHQVEARYRWDNLDVDGGDTLVAAAYCEIKKPGADRILADQRTLVKARAALVAAVERLVPEEADVAVASGDYFELSHAIRAAMKDDRRTTRADVTSLITFAGELMTALGQAHNAAKEKPPVAPAVPVADKQNDVGSRVERLIVDNLGRINPGSGPRKGRGAEWELKFYPERSAFTIGASVLHQFDSRQGSNSRTQAIRLIQELEKRTGMRLDRAEPIGGRFTLCFQTEDRHHLLSVDAIIAGLERGVAPRAGVMPHTAREPGSAPIGSRTR
jgi:hypothetical protein